MRGFFFKWKLLLQVHHDVYGNCVRAATACSASSPFLDSREVERNSRPRKNCNKRAEGGGGGGLGERQEKEERKRNYPVEEMYSNQCLCQAFHIIPFLNLTYASTLLSNYRTIGKIL